MQTVAPGAHAKPLLNEKVVFKTQEPQEGWKTPKYDRNGRNVEIEEEKTAKKEIKFSTKKNSN
jgi:hypothetical protein